MKTFVLACIAAMLYMQVQVQAGGYLLYTSQKGYHIGVIDINTNTTTTFVPFNAEGKPQVDRCIGLGVSPDGSTFCFSNDDPGDKTHQYNSSGVLCTPTSNLNATTLLVDWDTGALCDPTGVAVGSNFVTYVDQGLNKAYVVPKGGSPTAFFEPSSDDLSVFDIAVDATAGYIFVALNGARANGEGAVYVFDSSGNPIQKLFPNVAYVYSVDVDVKNQLVWIAAGYKSSSLQCAPYGNNPCPSHSTVSLPWLATGVAVVAGSDLIAFSVAAGTANGLVGAVNVATGVNAVYRTDLDTPFRVRYIENFSM